MMNLSPSKWLSFLEGTYIHFLLFFHSCRESTQHKLFLIIAPEGVESILTLEFEIMFLSQPSILMDRTSCLNNELIPIINIIYLVVKIFLSFGVHLLKC